MKLQIASDIHTEFGETLFEIPKDSHDRILVLAGDIGIGKQSLDFIKEVHSSYKQVVYVAGNHEFYRREFYKTLQDLYEECLKLSNVYFLERDFVILEGVLIFGATFWTPGGDYTQNLEVMEMMSDFSLIKRFHPDKSYPVKVDPMFLKSVFKDTVAELNKEVEKHKDYVRKVVVVSHHAPSEKSSLPMFKGSNLNPFFYFDALKEVRCLNSIDLWIHGHMHNASDYYLQEDTRVVCNPSGYPGENSNVRSKFVEV